jgi:glutamine cyclotransferase
MTMRYLLLLSLIIISLLGCQSQVQQSEPAGIFVSATESVRSPTVNASSSPSQAAVTAPLNTEPAVPAQIVTQTAELVPTGTQEVQKVSPEKPSPTIQATFIPLIQVTETIEPIWGYRVVNEFPHDATAYTQGLVIEDDLSSLLEGTGRDSSLRRVDLQTGTVEQIYALPDNYFGEGITLFEDKIYQLTWRSEIGFIYDSETFEQIAEFYYPHEGWGLTHNGTHLIVSDGTETIRFWDPATLEEVRRIEVKGVNGPVTQLNELEYVNGEIWANVWHTDLIARISPEDGRILGWIDLAGILDPQMRPDSEAVLNGIAYNDVSGRLFVTGKYWPVLFEIKIEDQG